MKQISTTIRLGVVIGAVAVGATALASTNHNVHTFFTGANAYTVPIDDDYEIKPLLTVGDRVPETSDPTKQYQMVGIPDGMGAHASGRNRVTVYMNHELGSANTLSEPTIGDPLNRGAFVSKLILDRDGGIISGQRAYDRVYLDDQFIGPAAAQDNATRGFARFCSGSLAGPDHGFDRYIYFANEEAGGTGTFDGLGGLSVAVFDNEAHGLTYLGRFPWENTLVQPNTGRWTVIMGMEDGPATLDPAQVNSQLYMYVGYKSRRHNATVLERNGLVGGKLYVFKSKDPAKNSELPFQTGSITGEWVEIPNANTMSDTQLEAASDAVGAMTFGRPEDGAFNTRNNDEYFFVTTGGATGANALGRLYSLKLNSYDVTKSAKLTVIYNADKIIAAGGDIAISPDNIDVSDKYLMINEDGTTESRAVMTAKNRDGAVWRFRLGDRHGVDVDSARIVAELDPPGRNDNNVVGAGVWETTGIIDSTELFSKAPHGWGRTLGTESWLFNVQAHPPTTIPPGTVTVEDGQLVLMFKKPSRSHHLPWFFWHWR